METVAAWTFLAVAANPQSPQKQTSNIPKKAYPQAGYAFSHFAVQWINAGGTETKT